MWNSTGLHARVRSEKKLVIIERRHAHGPSDVPKYVEKHLPARG
jgi:hypothetical protein